MIYIQTLKALVDASSWDSRVFFSIKDQKQGKCIMTTTSATEDTNRKKRNEMKRWKTQWIQTTVSKDRWSPPAITHEVRLLDSKLKAPRCSRVHITHVFLHTHRFHQLTDGFGKQNIYDRGKKSSHSLSLCDNPGSALPPLKIFEQLSQKKHRQGLKSFWTWNTSTCVGWMVIKLDMETVSTVWLLMQLYNYNLKSAQPNLHTWDKLLISPAELLLNLFILRILTFA